MMEYPSRTRLGHEIPSWVAEGSLYFITINCRPRGENQLCRDGVGKAVLSAAKHHHERLVWYCRLVLLMPDHLHAIIAFRRGAGMKSVVNDWKRYLAGHHQIHWQRDFFDHRLRTHCEEQEKISYILQNPVRRGLCEVPEQWPWIYRPADRLPPALNS